MVEAMRERPKATAMLAVLLLSAGLVLGLAREAVAVFYYDFRCSETTRCGSWPRDSDGTVPQRVGDLNPNGYGDGYITRGRTTMMWSTTEGIAKITYDHHAIDYCNSLRGPVYDHERAHARGFNHGEGSPIYNDAYYPSSQPCRPS